MPEPCGFLIQFDEEQRTEYLREVRGIEDGFSDALSSADWPLKKWEVCGLLFEQGVITHWSLARSTRRVVTGKVRVEFTRVSSTRISLAEIETRVNLSIRHHIVRARSGVGGRVPPTSWRAFKRAVGQIDPLSLDTLEKLERERDRNGVGERPGATMVAQQRDATGLALDIFDRSRRLRKRVLRECAPTSDGNLTSFLDGLRSVRTIEDQLIARDTMTFNSAQGVRYTAVGAVFDIGGRKLEVFNVNRHRIEEDLGVDLLYRNDVFDAWTLVQYKVMSEGYAKHSYYRADVEFDSGLKKMHRFRTEEPDSWNIECGRDSYRLCGDGFYFKLCSRVQTEQLSSELLPGMYLPRQFAEAILADPTLRGPQGGRIISFENAARHLTNTLFADLVRDGWIGTRGMSSSRIGAIVQEAFMAKRSVVLARSRPHGVPADPNGTLDILGLDR